MGRRKKPESGQPQGGTPEPQRRKTLTIAAIIAACLALAGVAGLNIWEKVNHPALAGGSKGTDAAAGGESEASGSARASRAVSGAPPETSNGGRAPQRVQSVDSPAKTPAAPGGAPAAAREARALHNPSIATATKDAPFVNSLGMKFVPVPITGGPTGGQRVLFSVWETRVQDYEAFAKETKREWLTPKFEQGPTHPAVMVTWHDATAFCAWLTAQEQKSGKLAANWCYRLPRNEEWSRALGIGGDDFLWGPQWPPPDKTANFESEELRAAFAAGSYPNPLNAESQLPGYRDGFAETAPVGSFRANPLGLYDLEGNVIEWCDDWEDDSKVRRTNRGAAWKMSGKLQLRASSRVFYPPEARGDFIGFRVVLVPGR